MDYLISLYGRLYGWWKAPLLHDKDRNYNHLPMFALFLFLLFVAPIWLGFSFLSWPAVKGDEPGKYEYIKPYEVVRNNPVNTEVDSLKDDEVQCQSVECRTHQSKEHQNEFNKDKRDVNAQEGMWRAANALVFLTVIQVMVGGMTMLFLILTFRTQRSELGVASEANSIEFQPYLDVSFKKVGLYKSSDHLQITFVEQGETGVPAQTIPNTGTRGLSVRIKIENKGKSPASHIFVDFDGEKSYFAYTGKGNAYSGGVYKTTAARPSFSQDFIVLAEGKITAIVDFPIEMPDSFDGIDFFEAQWVDKDSFKLTNYQIIDLEVRYKDFTCRSGNFHKVIRGSLLFTDSRAGRNGRATLWADTCLDARHHHYKNYDQNKA